MPYTTKTDPICMAVILKFNLQRATVRHLVQCVVVSQVVDMAVADEEAHHHAGGLVEAGPALHVAADSAAAAEVVESVAVCAEAIAHEEGADRHLLRGVHPDHHQSREVYPEAHLSRDHQPQGQGRQRPGLDHPQDHDLGR